MARPAADRVKAVWTGTGTGTLTLGGAASGEPVQAFPAALDGLIVGYLIKHDTAQEAEAGYGLYTHSGTTLSRLYVTYPTDGGSPVSFSAGTKHVSVTPIHSLFVPNFDTVDPDQDDNIETGFLAGMTWVNTSTGSVWLLVDHGVGSPNTTTWVRIDGAGVTLDQHDILARIASGSGAAAAVADGDLTEEAAPEAGDFLLGWVGGALRKINVGNLPATNDAAPTEVPSDAATFALTDAARMHNNVRVVSHQASVVFEVPQAASKNSEWRIEPLHDGCTVTINGGVGTLTPSTARLVNGGLAIVTVTNNPGSAPVVVVRADVIVPPTSVTTKTYDADDHGQDFVATGTQTFGAASGFPSGFYVNIWNNTGSNLTIDGADADHTVPARGVVVVRKIGTGLICNGSGGDTLLDAS